MTLKIILPAAFAALALSGSAFAQEYTFRGTAVPADQVQLLVDHCTALLNDASGADDEGATATDPTNSDSTAAVDFANLDIASVTISDCRDGGFAADDDGPADDNSTTTN